MINIKANGWEICDIRAVLFDKDGTFIDVHTYWGRIIERRSAAIIAKYNLPKGEFDGICRAFGWDYKARKLMNQGPVALLPRAEVVEALCAKMQDYGQKVSIEEMTAIFDAENILFQKEIYQYIKLLDGAKELFAALKRAGAKTAVITSDSRENTKQILEHLGIDEYFDLVLGREDCQDHKRTGIPALQALGKLGVEKQYAITVGDAPMDSDMAKNGGLKGSILTATGQITGEQLKEHSPYTVSSLTEAEVLTI